VELAGKVALVTGGGHGIGAAITEAYARCGAHVVVNYFSSESAAIDTARHAEKHGVEAITHRADVSVAADVDAMVARAVERFGRLDILVNNASAPVARIPFAEPQALPEDVWDRTMAVNLKGPFLCAAAATPHLRTSGGVIINIGSIGGIRPRSSNLAYACAKAAVVHLTECLAASLGPAIRVNCVVPGITPTTRVLPDTPPVGPLGRHVDIDDFASAVIECTRNDSVTGATWLVDVGAVLT
jgi:3-oxoacyl-[acyl-carrier protein] reductase